MFLFLILSLIIKSFERCHPNCETCTNFTLDDRNMGCIECKEGYFFLENTNNCFDYNKYPSYYINETRMFPCSNFPDMHCNLCMQNETQNIYCLSCEKGYEFNIIYDQDKCPNYDPYESDYDCRYSHYQCDKCEENQMSILSLNIQSPYNLEYQTTCFDESTSIEDFICILYSGGNPEMCLDSDCRKTEYICSNEEKNNLRNNININWFNNEFDLNFPSYNDDNSDYLLIEFTPHQKYFSYSISASLTNKRY